VTLGSSGGRSAKNRQSGPRRATPRERAAIDPPGHSEWEKVKLADEYHWEDHLTPRGRKVVGIIAWGSYMFVCVLLAVLVCAWFGLI
jgi:hypothetical protein